ncbi:MAG: MarR family transcriptional regulator [Syntrophomonadaceae bacterium]|jgi:hypothetical protein|nr:MarR family transcriptional regulator [Syntrophomonadaceae bacterium]
MSNEEIVLNTFKDAAIALKAGDVAEISGLDKKEVDKIIKKLKKEDKLESPKRCYYQPK